MDNAVQCLRESAAGSTAFGEFRKSYNGCPICGHSITTFLCEANCQGHPLWRPPLPTSMKWNTCNQCGHIFTEGFFTENALNYLFSQANEGQIAGGDLDSQRMLWSPVVERVVRALPDQSRNSEGGHLAFGLTSVVAQAGSYLQLRSMDLPPLELMHGFKRFEQSSL